MAHDPARQARVAEARQQGGLARSNAARARRELLAAGALSAEEVLALLGLTMRRLAAGRVESGVASAMASLGRAWFAGRQAVTLETLERRLAELEAAESRERPAGR